MDITALPTKILYSDPVTNYRVISCQIMGHQPNDFELNSYNNFTISGNNISFLKLGETCDVNLVKDENSKYPASYILVGLVGLDIIDSEIVVDQKQEFPILCNLMEESQAKYVLEAYPNFVQDVLRGNEASLDYKKIYNVGKVRFESYVDKIKREYKSILYYPAADQWGVTNSNEISNLVKLFATPEEMLESFDKNPYHVYMDLLEWGFSKADKMVLDKKPELIDSVMRCEYSCMHVLRDNEHDGDTRVNANVLAALVEDVVPEAMGHIVEAVSNCDFIHYNPETKYSAMKDTYEAECKIADEINKRVEHPIETPMDWEKFKVVDGFECTEEQTEILRLACNQSVAILTGGSGVGKTSSTKALVRMLEAHGKSYTLLSPTGIASKRLKECTGRPAHTVHMFLARDMEAGEFVILDESSMISVHLLASLFKKMPEYNPNSCLPQTKIIFVCDEAQLASIACGNVVQDILDNRTVPRANLTKVFRYNSSGISTIATDIRFGKNLGLNQPYPDFNFIPINDNPISQIIEQYEALLSDGYTVDDIMVLCPYNKSQIGTYNINNYLQSRFNTHEFTDAHYEIKGSAKIRFKVGDKVINTKNNYRTPSLEFDEDGALVNTDVEIPIMNGDIGKIIACSKDDYGAELAVQFDEGIAKFTGQDIANLLLGYAISTHKSQGSQAKAVIVVVDKSHKNMLSRNLCYVAVSRAQEKLVLIGDEEVIDDALKVQEEKERDTWLKDLLKPIDKSQ